MREILFKSIVGSQAYGTSTPASDIDIKGVYLQPNDEILGTKYKEQINVTKDETYYELRRFLELAMSANPTILELMYSPDRCIIEKSPKFDIILEHRDKFLTKKCAQSFGGYAIAQIKKAKGLDKKINWELNRMTRKTPIDFCYFWSLDQKQIPLSSYLSMNKTNESEYGLSSINHFQNCYEVYKGENMNGICSIDSNEVKLTSIPKGMEPIGMIYFNKDGYSTHCSDYNSYQTWIENRNISRYIDVVGHNQKIDGKNLLHCRRLLDMAMEIATTKTINVERKNAEYLLSIRKGMVDLETLIDQSERDIKILDNLFKDSNLPDEVDDEFINDLIIKIRKI